jgi:hypothetical protein
VATCHHPRLLRPLERGYCCLGYLEDYFLGHLVMRDSTASQPRPLLSVNPVLLRLPSLVGLSSPSGNFHHRICVPPGYRTDSTVCSCNLKPCALPRRIGDKGFPCPSLYILSSCDRCASTLGISNCPRRPSLACSGLIRPCSTWPISPSCVGLLKLR